VLHCSTRVKVRKRVGALGAFEGADKSKVIERSYIACISPSNAVAVAASAVVSIRNIASLPWLLILSVLLSGQDARPSRLHQPFTQAGQSSRAKRIIGGLSAGVTSIGATGGDDQFSARSYPNERRSSKNTDANRNRVYEKIVEARMSTRNRQLSKLDTGTKYHRHNAR
jgi:hypothetical protein